MTSRSRAVATPARFSSKSNSIEQEHPHLSAGAYIRSLILKQLNSSSSTARSRAQHLHAMSGLDQQGHEQAAVKPQVKKQTRRRAPTSRPFQEKLLNMAEARREIVTALRIHRANMRQQSSKYQQEQRRQRRLQQPVHHQVMFQDQSQAFEGVLPPAVTTSYAASSSNNHLWSSSPFANSYGLTPLEEEVPAAIVDLEQLACSLPAQPLGLNLSFHGFGGSLDYGKNSGDPFGVPSIQQSSSCSAASSYSAYSSSPVTAMPGLGEYSSIDAPVALSQRVLDGDGEMLYSIGGERQSMELSETAANVAAASAWWTKILESAGAPPQATATGAEAGMADDDILLAAGWPELQWLCDGGSVEQEVTAAGPKPDVLEMHVDDGGCYEGDRGGNGHDIALPCVNDMELGWDDGEWFS